MRGEFGGSWTERKLKIVGEYLQTYSTALKNRGFDLTYIDAFAGTGKRSLDVSGEDRDQLTLDEPVEIEQFSRGSALIALNVVPPFDRYILIELDPGKCLELRDTVQTEFGQLSDRVSILNEDCNRALQQLAVSHWRNRRAVLFLDPFGMQVSFDTMRAIAKTGAIDVWVLFAHGLGVNRLLPRHGRIQSGSRAKLNAIFGTDEWESRFYQQTGQLSLVLGDPETQKVATLDEIAGFYKERLASEFAYVHPKSITLVNSKNSPMFSLCFAMANQSPKAVALASRFATHLLRD
jgi:three-Cys-motif partner protein